MNIKNKINTILVLILFVNLIQSQIVFKDLSLLENYNIYADENGYCNYEFDFFFESGGDSAQTTYGTLISLNDPQLTVYKLFWNASSSSPVQNQLNLLNQNYYYPNVTCENLPTTLDFVLLSDIPNKVSNNEFNINLIINNINKIIPVSSFNKLIKTYCPDYYECSTSQVGYSNYFITSIKFANYIQNIDFNINYEVNNKNTTFTIKSPIKDINLNNNGLNLNSFYEINDNLKSLSTFLNLKQDSNVNGIISNVFLKFSNNQFKLLSPVLGSLVNGSNIGIQLFTSSNIDSSVTSDNVELLYFTNGKLMSGGQVNSQQGFDRTYNELSSSTVNGEFNQYSADGVLMVTLSSTNSNYYESILNDNTFIQFPFGFKSISSKSNPATFNRELSININEYTLTRSFAFENQQVSVNIPKLTTLIDSVPPTIVSMKLESVGILSILKIEIQDALSGFLYLELSNGVKLDSSFLVEGDLLSGKYEYIFNLLDLDYQPQLRVKKICDAALNCDTFTVKGYQSNTYNLNLGDSFPLLGNPTVSLDNITSFSFLQNSIDTTNQNIFSSLYFNFSNVNPQTDYPPYLELFNDGKTDLDYKFNQIIDKIIFQAYWNYELKLYQVDFTIRKNQFTTDDFTYWLVYQGERFSNTVLQSKFISKAKLSISSNYADTLGPVVTAITPLQDKYQLEITQDTPVKVGWKFNIHDQYNGFSFGFVQLISQETGKIYNVSLTPAIVGLSDNEIDVYVNFTGNCVTQHLSIKQIYLQDTGGYSTYEILDNPSYSTNSFSPLINIINAPSLFVECYKIDESILPSLVSLEISKTQLDVGSEDRNVKVTFEVYDNSGIDLSQTPICYLENTASNIYQVNAQVIKTNITNTQFLCDMEVPIGFGYQDNILLSIYGIFDHSNLVGFSSKYLKEHSLPYFINVNKFTLTTPAIYSVSKFFSSDSLITIIGRSLDDSFIQIDYLQGFGFENITGDQQPIKGDVSGSSSILISTINKIGFPFNVRVINSNTNQISNTFRVVPIISGVLPTDSNIDNPVECSKDCGGSDHGTCTPNGCVCILPYTGIDCLSKITYIENYTQLNSTNPIIKLLNNNNDQLTKTIDILLLREVDINGNVIKVFNLNQWNIIANQTDGFKYTTSIFDNNNYETKIIVSTVWNSISNATSIQYQVDISAYPFSSDETKLELIISNQLDIASTYKGVVCSNSNSSIDLLNSNIINNKLTMNQDSILNQINLIASIDNAQGEISTHLLNTTSSTINNGTNIIKKGDSINNLIAITIPQYNVMVSVNSKYTIIKESTVLTNDKSTICISKNIKGKDGLSDQQKAATAIGVIGFFLISSMILWFFIIKPKRDAQRLN